MGNIVTLMLLQVQDKNRIKVTLAKSDQGRERVQAFDS